LLPPNLLPGSRADAYFDPLKDIAYKDAQRFNLPKPMLLRFKTEHFPVKSDYFKPTAGDTSDPTMLADSAYVQTFRLEAHDRASHQK
jgi:hypothetical protein